MNEVLDAIKTRIKSPYFGYATLAFFALNWRAIFLLVATEAEPIARLAAFDSVTSYWSLVILPLFAGAVVAASTHWLRYLFLLIAEKPLDLIENSNLKAEHRRSLRHAELEESRVNLTATKEKELIERAKRDEKIAEITDESKKKELENQIGEIRKKRGVSISETANELLVAAASEDNGTIMKPRTMGEQSIQAGKKSFGAKSKRAYAEYDAALNELITKGLVKEVGAKGEIFELTHDGWKLADAS